MEAGDFRPSRRAPRGARLRGSDSRESLNTCWADRHMPRRPSPSKQEVGDLLALVGLAVEQAQEFESYLAEAVVFGVSPARKRRDHTIGEEIAGRHGMTLGHLMSEFRSSWHIHPGLESYLSEFLRRRNVLMHELFVTPGLGYSSRKELDTTEKWLDEFLEMAIDAVRLARFAFKATMTFSAYLAEKEGRAAPRLSDEDYAQAQFFLLMCKPRDPLNPNPTIEWSEFDSVVSDFLKASR
jgi:hypothetical protein